MSVKSGYGRITENLVNPYVLGLPVDGANRNAIIQLPAKEAKRIFTISCSYAVSGINAANSVRGIFGGRLLVVGTKYEGFDEEIIPDIRDLPVGLEGATVYFDMFIGSQGRGAPQASTGRDGIQNIREHFEFANGLLIPEGTDASVILTYCLDDVDTATVDYQASVHNAGIMSSLNVYGHIGGSDRIYKNV